MTIPQLKSAEAITALEVEVKELKELSKSTRQVTELLVGMVNFLRKELEELKMAEKKNWIAGAIRRPGALRKKLKVKAGKKIPADKLEKAEHSKNPTTRKQANLAKTLKKMHKK